MLEYASTVKDDALNKGLLQEKGELKKNIRKKIITSIIIYILMILCFIKIPSIFFPAGATDSNMEILGIILLIIFFAILLFMPSSIIVYIIHYIRLNNLDPYVRNKEGKAINIKLEGLRKFLNDFSKIEDKNKEQLIL